MFAVVDISHPFMIFLDMFHDVHIVLLNVWATSITISINKFSTAFVRSAAPTRDLGLVDVITGMFKPTSIVIKCHHSVSFNFSLNHAKNRNYLCRIQLQTKRVVGVLVINLKAIAMTLKFLIFVSEALDETTSLGRWPECWKVAKCESCEVTLDEWRNCIRAVVHLW